ncbi:MAG: iron-sulfur cluster assembly scaffold protein [Candidatus Micrarchaeaceae archaeon]
MDLDMYAEGLLQSYEHPINRGIIEKPEIERHEENISCGDKITVYLKIKNNKIEDIKFDGTGCVISMGSTDILINELKGKDINELEKFKKEQLLKILGIDPGPVRMHCATLSLRAIKKGIFEYLKKEPDQTTKEL